jgi:branched-chain amino acid transport system ATP-binding protein
MNEALLNVKSVAVRYEKAEALVDVSLSVFSGQVVAIIGPNGAGKSTLLRAISGLKKLSRGQILFNGTKIDGLSPSDIVRLGIIQVPEGKRIFRHMSVLQNLELGAYARKRKSGIKEDLEKVFDLFPILRRRKKQAAGTLSGGEQQMLAIARGLMGEPKLLLLDEPSIGLAPLLVTKIGEILKDIYESGVNILLVEQNAELALGLATMVYVISTGRIILAGETRELSETEFIKKAYIGM